MVDDSKGRIDSSNMVDTAVCFSKKKKIKFDSFACTLELDGFLFYAVSNQMDCLINDCEARTGLEFCIL